jgi:hypothetical protein
VPLGVTRILDALEQLRVPTGAHLSEAELAHLAGLDPPAELLRHGLHAVADAEHGNAELEYRLGRTQPLHRGDRLGPAGEHDAPGLALAQRVLVDVAGNDLRVSAGVADPARDELGVLRAEIQDQDQIVMDAHGAPSRLGGRLNAAFEPRRIRRSRRIKEK